MTETLDEFLDNFPTVIREAAIAALEQAKSPNVCESAPALTECVKTFHDTNDVNRGRPEGWNNAHGIDNGMMDGFLGQSFLGRSGSRRIRSSRRAKIRAT